MIELNVHLLVADGIERLFVWGILSKHSSCSCSQSAANLQSALLFAEILKNVVFQTRFLWFILKVSCIFLVVHVFVKRELFLVVCSLVENISVCFIIVVPVSSVIIGFRKLSYFIFLFRSPACEHKPPSDKITHQINLKQIEINLKILTQINLKTNSNKFQSKLVTKLA